VGTGQGGPRPGSTPRMRLPRLSSFQRLPAPDPVASPARTYCTYFDRHYLARGVAMIRSLLWHDPGAVVHVLALDDDCARGLRTLCPGTKVIGMADLQAYEPRLRGLRDERSNWAYYATQKPVLALFLLDGEARPDSILFIDADTWFFSNPAAIFAEIGDASIGLSPHRFPAESQSLLRYGAFNAGCIYWRRDSQSRICLAQWRDDCLTCCDEQARSDGRFMNQGYLTRWPERYPGVHIIGHPGVNLAPWNIDSHVLKRAKGGLRIDGRELIFYHYSGLVRDPEGGWCSIYPHKHRKFDLVRDAIYRPYLSAVEAVRTEVLQVCGMDGNGSVRKELTALPQLVHFYPEE
jgi:hypothetical protein